MGELEWEQVEWEWHNRHSMGDGTECKCPLMAISGHLAPPQIMSALPPKADILRVVTKGLLLTQSGHSLDYRV